MTTIQQQLDFITELRENYESSERTRITTYRNPNQVVELLRGINENLIGVRNWQMGNPAQFCSDCNTALTEHNRVNYAAVDSHIIVTRNEHVCDKCTDIRIERIKAQ